jgi:hypothetical protein
MHLSEMADAVSMICNKHDCSHFYASFNKLMNGMKACIRGRPRQTLSPLPSVIYFASAFVPVLQQSYTTNEV